MRRRMMSRMRLPTPAPPAEIGMLNGLSYTLWLPDRDPEGGLLVLHGADSRKENHHDMARAARGAGLAAVCFDMRGHGASEGALGASALDDVAAIASLLPRPLALRGSSMGGYMAICAAEQAGASAIVAVCPAAAAHLQRGLRDGTFDFRADSASLEALLAEHDPIEVVARSEIALMLQHAEGDERVPWTHSKDLHERSATTLKRLIVLPGGHHRSIQHDAEMQAEALRFVRRAFREAGPPRTPPSRPPDPKLP
jgi:pimeloyl-ACP methyl ester carboxylesterase